jgi:hypothetical protein
LFIKGFDAIGVLCTARYSILGLQGMLRENPAVFENFWLTIHNSKNENSRGFINETSKNMSKMSCQVENKR